MSSGPSLRRLLPQLHEPERLVFSSFEKNQFPAASNAGEILSILFVSTEHTMFLTRRPAKSHDELSRLHHEMNRMFDGFLSPAVGFWPAVTNRPAVAYPKLDVSESDTAVLVSAELPGVSQDQIDVEIHADTLRISGEKKDERVVDQQNFHFVERSFGRFDRVVNLPVEVDSKQAEATFKDGVLSISLPKVKPVEAQKITVKAAT